MISKISLVFGGKKYEGFSSLNLTKELTGIVHGFDLEITDLNALLNIQNFLRNDVLVQVYFGETLLTTGYIDTTESSSDFTLKISGRSKGSSLVDCGTDKKQYNNITIQNLIKTVCTPFGINFKDETALSKRKNMVGEGEPGLELFKKWLEGEDVFLTSDASGDLILKKSATKTLKKLAYGENIYSYSITYDYSNVFTEYNVFSSQSDNMGSKTTYKGTYKDDYLKRYKPVNIDSSKAKDKASCIEEAKKSSATTKSRMMTLSMECPVYIDESKSLLEIGDTVLVKLTPHGVEKNFIVNRVSLNISSSSFRSNVELVDEEAFSTMIKGSDVLFKYDGAFARAFAQARRAGQDVFIWKGNNYNTLLKGE